MPFGPLPARVHPASASGLAWLSFKHQTLNLSSKRCKNQDYAEWACVSRAAEEELVATADERDSLVPQLEEAKWRARQADKDKSDLQVALDAAKQVLFSKENLMQGLPGFLHSLLFVVMLNG